MKVVSVTNVYESSSDDLMDGRFLGLNVNEIGSELLGKVVASFPGLMVDFGGGERDILGSLVRTECGGSATKLAKVCSITKAEAEKVLEYC